MRLHERLRADTHCLGQSGQSTLLLHRNASIPWFILVPHTEETLLFKVPLAQRQALEEHMSALASWIHERYACQRVNTAAIGNLVPQLHLHLVARHEEDPCWPGVVWGAELPEASYDSAQLEELRAALREQQLIEAERIEPE